ncbi:MAG: HAMP domain-containing sensor histidine kinase [Syntrophomonadaceae bacterium]|nr:HAMP domain-containing sensor histidine kinase [Syntrophomonadaceae bacterium]
MFQELRSMRLRLTLYYTLVLVLFTFLFIGFAFYNIFYADGFMLDRELKINAGQVNDLNIIPDIIPEVHDERPAKKVPDGEKNADALFKFILRDEDMQITNSSLQYQAMFQRSQELAQQSWLSRKGRWDTINLDGIEYRIYSVPFHKNNENGVVQTYCNLTMIHKLISRFSYVLMGTGMIAILFAAFIGWWLAGRAMMPVRLAWQRQKEFIADVSHELRTPLTIIQSNLDVVVADQNGSIKDNINWLQNAYSETSNMGKLVNDLLFLSRIDAQEIKFNHNEFNLSSLLSELVFQFAPLFQNKNLKFSSGIEPGVKMYGDEVRIRQMVSIFLDNAFKYTPNGGSVNLKMRKIQNAMEIVIEDSGIGFDESEREKIFMRFYRIDKARSRKQGGTGLGLAIAAWIADEHKGTIKVFSKPGKGSTFKVFFPKS